MINTLLLQDRSSTAALHQTSEQPELGPTSQSDQEIAGNLT